MLITWLQPKLAFTLQNVLINLNVMQVCFERKQFRNYTFLIFTDPVTIEFNSLITFYVKMLAWHIGYH